jgi:hypothetical protein
MPYPPPPHHGIAPPPYGGPAAAQADPALHGAIGANSDYYLRSWAAMDSTGSSTSWNWAAFLLNGFWLAYRKMWGLMILYVALILAIVGAVGALLLTKTVEIEVAAALWALLIIPAAWLGLKGNALYRSHVQRVLVETGASIYDPASLERARRRGGTSIAGPILLYVAISLIVGGATYYLVNETDLLDDYIDGRSRSTSLLSDEGKGNSLGAKRDTSIDVQVHVPGESTGGVSEAFLLGRWSDTAANCNTIDGSILFSGGGRVEGDGEVGSWYLVGDQLTITPPDQAPRTATIVQSGPNLMTMTNAQGATMSFVRC